MRRLRMSLAVIACCVLLVGCQSTGEVENQAYVLVLGVDRVEDGQLLLTATVPKIGKGGGSDEEKAQNSPYLHFSVSGDSWTAALEALQWATPRQVNLSHIEMLVVSHELAGEAEFPVLMRQMAQTPHLYANARFVVCSGQTREFVEAGETIIGTRMSAELKAMLRHYATQGYIPDSSFAEACYLADSIYSDPVAIWANETVEEKISTSGNGSGALNILETPMKQCFSGTALLREGVFLNALSPEDTRLLRLARGERSALTVDCSGKRYELTPESATRQVEFGDSGVELRLSVRLSASVPLCSEDEERIEGDLESALTGLIRRCQDDRCDPFGFAEAAASHFVTVLQWQAFDWRNCYAAAQLAVDVNVKGDTDQ